MTSTLPTVRQISWVSLLPQITLMGIFVLIYYFIGTASYILYGAWTYLLLSFGGRAIVLRSHKKGMSSVKQGNFAGAIPHFQKSYDFFQTNGWIDKYRYLILSSSKISFREMALNNIAFCYSQTGQGGLAEEYYLRTLREFPESGLATSALRMINSAKANG